MPTCGWHWRPNGTTSHAAARNCLMSLNEEEAGTCCAFSPVSGARFQTRELEGELNHSRSSPSPNGINRFAVKLVGSACFCNSSMSKLLIFIRRDHRQCTILARLDELPRTLQSGLSSSTSGIMRNSAFPERSLDGFGFGVVSGASSKGRVIQFGLKLLF